MMKLNIGCGGRPLDGYVNIDQDSIEALKKRYPNNNFSDDLEIKNYDIFNLPFEDETVSEIRADGLLEHLSFKQEPKFLFEVFRVLKPGGIFEFAVPDFEATCRAWLAAKDDWQDFFSDSQEDIEKEHWFGTYSYGYENRWGYIIATFYGSQNGAGQFHQNAYSEGKIKKMLKRVGYIDVHIQKTRWKNNRDYILQTKAIKG